MATMFNSTAAHAVCVDHDADVGICPDESYIRKKYDPVAGEGRDDICADTDGVFELYGGSV